MMTRTTQGLVEWRLIRLLFASGRLSPFQGSGRDRVCAT
jgi:hypothetical protein